MESIKTNEMIEKFRRADFKGFGKNGTFSSWAICPKASSVKLQKFHGS